MFSASSNNEEARKGLISGQINLSRTLQQDVGDLESQQTFFQKGAVFASKGFVYVSDSARTVVQGAQTRIEDATTALSPQRLTYFGVFAGVGVLFIFLAFLFFPLVVVAPQKFALLFTAGSLSIIGSLVILKGANNFLSHFMSWERLPFSAAYFSSLLVCLYVTVGMRSYVLALLSSLVQIVCLASLLASYMPGGLHALKLVRDFLAGALRRLLQLS